MRDHTSEEAALQRAASVFAGQLDRLAEGHQSLAQLMRRRVTRPWTSYEHAAYLRLRHAGGETYQRLLRTQRTFDRIRLRDLRSGEGSHDEL
jgi:hypothetical protein